MSEAINHKLNIKSKIINHDIKQNEFRLLIHTDELYKYIEKGNLKSKLATVVDFFNYFLYKFNIIPNDLNYPLNYSRVFFQGFVAYSKVSFCRNEGCHVEVVKLVLRCIIIILSNARGDL